MSITIKQLEELARHFHFDVDEARRFLGKEPKKRGRPSKTDSDSDSESPKKCSGAECLKSPVKRGPSGYNLFVKGSGVPFADAGPQWKALSDSARERWNAKAKGASSSYESPKTPVGKKSPKTTEEKAPTKRGPSGYNLFVKGSGVPFAEAAKQWKSLSDSARGKWNNKAKAM